jgi:hypothetical protein
LIHEKRLILLISHLCPSELRLRSAIHCEKFLVWERTQKLPSTFSDMMSLVVPESINHLKDTDCET